MKPELLVEIKRGQITEKQHFGFIIAVDKNENIFFKKGDDENGKFWFRSAAKPLQASLILKSGAYNKFNLNSQELAVCCASHTGTGEHVLHVQSILHKIGLGEANLKCGVHEPIDKQTRDSIISCTYKDADFSAFSQLHNNCSGKHAGMLAVCVMNNWELANYLDFDHPLQKKIKKTIAKFCNFSEDEIELERDGCSAPVHALPYIKMGVGYLNLFFDSEYAILKKAFQENPVLIGGNGRLDTEIIKATSGRLISKVGAEGLCITVNTENEQALIVKILDADPKARFLATIRTLRELGWISEKELHLFYC